MTMWTHLTGALRMERGYQFVICSLSRKFGKRHAIALGAATRTVTTASATFRIDPIIWFFGDATATAV
jgi:hypothetical protein